MVAYNVAKMFSNLLTHVNNILSPSNDELRPMGKIDRLIIFHSMKMGANKYQSRNYHLGENVF